MIRIYDLDRRLGDVEMIGGKMHVISYVDWLQDFEDLRLRIAKDRPVSDQELYDSLTEQLAAYVWAERDD